MMEQTNSIHQRAQDIAHDHLMNAGIILDASVWPVFLAAITEALTQQQPTGQGMTGEEIEMLAIEAAKYGFNYRGNSQHHGEVPEGNVLQWLQWYLSSLPNSAPLSEKEVSEQRITEEAENHAKSKIKQFVGDYPIDYEEAVNICKSSFIAGYKSSTNK